MAINRLAGVSGQATARVIVAGNWVISAIDFPGNFGGGRSRAVNPLITLTKSRSVWAAGGWDRVAQVQRNRGSSKRLEFARQINGFQPRSRGLNSAAGSLRQHHWHRFDERSGPRSDGGHEAIAVRPALATPSGQPTNEQTDPPWTWPLQPPIGAPHFRHEAVWLSVFRRTQRPGTRRADPGSHVRARCAARSLAPRPRQRRRSRRRRRHHRQLRPAARPPSLRPCRRPGVRPLSPRPAAPRRHRHRQTRLRR